jgi:hypothetical protein
MVLGRASSRETQWLRLSKLLHIGVARAENDRDGVQLESASQHIPMSSMPAIQRLPDHISINAFEPEVLEKLTGSPSFFWKPAKHAAHGIQRILRTLPIQMFQLRLKR